ncbi:MULTISPECIES: hypothetical protein [unclassified Spirosoma]|uniref:hypothetical protein n=1 Tax=unclassified Spirosoma TaxID=2621999 RepID=UPI000958F7FA|nr:MULTISPECIES: hypothetical protein [unclassified Spirosoma]MBN8823182.1 hypothetical protein [Spirosoma sp.]OJW73263.1 MAG: hypothetical protein BGO59_07225 [Spirosoma sp. 48-14]
MNLQTVRTAFDQISDAKQFFEHFYDKLDDLNIREKVDKDGIDSFINECAIVAGAVGGATGLGGIVTTVVGIPVEITNNVFQQFRVTLAVIYHKTGQYKPSFPEFMKIVGMSIGVEVGATVTKAVLVAIANSLLTRMAAKTALRAIPILGAAVGATTNYLFILGIGKSLKGLNLGNSLN